jgi:hypothetical protein
MFFFIHEPQLGRVQRIMAEPDTERIENRIPLRIGLRDLRNLQRQELVVIDGHGSTLAHQHSRTVIARLDRATQ